MKTEAHSRDSLLLIGSGRLATHLNHYLKLLGVDHQTWSRHHEISVLDGHLEKKPTVFLAISDRALKSFYDEHLVGQSVVHGSGSFYSEKMISCHPLMTFGPDLYELEVYKKIHFAVTGTESLQNVLPQFPNSSFVMTSENKALYHALCVLSSAGAQTLWNAAEKSMGSLGVPSSAYRTFAGQIAANYVRDGAKALTGPWVRNDEETISQNLKALSARSKSLSRIYELLKEGIL